MESIKKMVKLPENKKKLYLGRVDDTTAKRREKDGKNATRILNTAKWSMPVNFAFMEAGGENKSTFKLATQFEQKVITKLIANNLDGSGFVQWIKTEKPKDLYTGSEFNDGLSVLALELEWLIDNGYVFEEKDNKDKTGKRLVAKKNELI